jgi:UPF0271 protein
VAWAIDLNCDLGESFGAWTMGEDEAVLPHVSSANVACGFHAGDPAAMSATLAAARRHGVQIGAHPGYPDRANFGRVEQDRAPDLVFQETVYQIGALRALAEVAGLAVRYVKPHGALYNQACRDAALAQPVVAAARALGLAVMGLPASALEAAARAQGVAFVAEGFADRRYLPDGRLVPRTQPDAFVTDPAAAVDQVSWLVRERGVQTICVHGDNPEAVALVGRLREALGQRGFAIRAFAAGA